MTAESHVHGDTMTRERIVKMIDQLLEAQVKGQIQIDSYGGGPKTKKLFHILKGGNDVVDLFCM